MSDVQIARRRYVRRSRSRHTRHGGDAGRYFRPGQVVAPQLLARDINGFRLDMTVREVAALAPHALEPWGNGFRATVNGVSYDFGFTPRGHLYRIDSAQNLGRFLPDREFGLRLQARLAAKYGIPHNSQLPDGPAFWTYVERYTANNGTQLNRETESFSAMLSGSRGQPYALVLKLMDFRILRRDDALLNARPEASADQSLSF